MTISAKTTLLAIAAVCAIALVTPALAKGKPEHAEKYKDNAQSSGIDIEVNIGLGDRERRIVRDYYSTQKNCPPGLAKKNNGCLPPGIAKKRYEIGRPIYDDAIVIELPHDIIIQLPPLSSGRGYRVVDGDLVVVALGTLVVLDAIGVF